MGSLRAKEEAAKWARLIMSDKLVAFLDTETTGLDMAEICQIAIVDVEGKILLDTLVKPSKPVTDGAYRIHRISNEILQNAPTWKEIQPVLLPIVQNYKIVTYNADFGWAMAQNSSEFAGLQDDYFSGFNGVWECAMEEFAEFYGEWNDYRRSFKWQKLSHAYEVMVREPMPDAHTALGDAIACRKVVEAMANYR